MYTSYSTLQRKQLSKQVYTDTQSTYLLVYAPGRHKALETALQNQLHRKFRLVTRLEGELTPAVVGVLLVSEDVECTPTARQPLRTGVPHIAGQGTRRRPGQGQRYRAAASGPCHGAAQLPHPAGAAALPPGAVRRRRVLRQGTPCADFEP